MRTIDTDPHAQTHVYDCKISKEKRSSMFDQQNTFPQREASTSIVSIIAGEPVKHTRNKGGKLHCKPLVSKKKTNLSKNYLIMHNHCIKLMS